MKAGRPGAAAASSVAVAKDDAKFLTRHCNLMTRHRARTPHRAVRHHATTCQREDRCRLTGARPLPVRIRLTKQSLRPGERPNAEGWLAFLIFMKARTRAWPSALPRKSVM